MKSQLLQRSIWTRDLKLSSMDLCLQRTRSLALPTRLNYCFLQPVFVEFPVLFLASFPSQIATFIFSPNGSLGLGKSQRSVSRKSLQTFFERFFSSAGKIYDKLSAFQFFAVTYFFRAFFAQKFRNPFLFIAKVLNYSGAFANARQILPPRTRSPK